MTSSDEHLLIVEQSVVVDEVLSVIRHDVRNKLAAARQASFYLQTKSKGTELWNQDPRVERFFGIIGDQLGAADTLMTEHDALARVSVREQGPLDAARVVDRAVLAARLPPEIELRRGPIVGAEVQVVEAELALAVRCLLQNASDAMEERGAIEISTTMDPEFYVFSIRDHGPGLTSDAFRGYTRPFLSSRQGRRGLGLSLARRVASRHGGALRLATSPDGAAVELTLRLPSPAGPP